jgi:hypothetical protein
MPQLAEVELYAVSATLLRSESGSRTGPAEVAWGSLGPTALLVSKSIKLYLNSPRSKRCTVLRLHSKLQEAYVAHIELASLKTA